MISLGLHKQGKSMELAVEVGRALPDDECVHVLLVLLELDNLLLYSSNVLLPDVYVYPHKHTTLLCIRGSPYANFLAIHAHFTYGDPHMHPAIPIYEFTHMGIQYLEIFPVCIWLVTAISPYAYGDRANPHMHTGISVM